MLMNPNPRRLPATLLPRPAVGLLSVCLLSGPALRADVMLVSDGKPRAVIVLGNPPSSAATQALKMLNSHFKQISGTELPVVRERDFKGGPTTARPCLFLGQSALAARHSFTTKGLQAGGVLVRATDNAVAVMGTDADTPADSSGTIYATTLFLERLGVRYLWPGEVGKVVPKRRTLTVGAFKLTHSPQLAQRNIRSMGYSDRLQVGLDHLGFTKEEFLKQMTSRNQTEADSLSWFKWQRLGGTMKLKSGHAFGYLWPKYGKDHPDWFALQPNGSRDQSFSSERSRLCVSNPELIAAIARDKIEELNQDRSYLGVSVGPNDGGSATFCTCPKCEALDNPNGRKIQLWDFTGKQRRYFDHVSLTDRMIAFWNGIAERVVKVHPDRFLVVDAYSAYAAPPLAREMHPNLVVRFASLGYSSEPRRQEALRDWVQWGNSAKRIYFRPNLMLAGRRDGMPLIYVHKFGDDFRFLAGHGMMGTDFDSCCHNWATQGLNYYVVARLHWDPSQKVDAIIDDYCRSGFGAGAPFMRRYFDRLESLMNQTAAAETKPYTAYTPAVLQELRQLLARAGEAVRDDAACRKRVAFVQRGLQWAGLEVRVHTMLEALPDIDQAAAKLLFDERRELMRDIFQNDPLAVNVAYVSWGEDGLVGRLNFKLKQ